jgi:hypothetical protein
VSAPGVTRTPGTGIRNPLLYPPELRGHNGFPSAIPSCFKPKDFALSQDTLKLLPTVIEVLSGTQRLYYLLAIVKDLCRVSTEPIQFGLEIRS